MTQEALSSEDVDKFFESGGQESPDIIEEQDRLEQASDEPQDAQVESDAELSGEEKEPLDNEIDRNLKAALSEERERRKELQRERQELVQQKQRMEEAFQRFVQEQQKTPEPSFDDDPIEATRHKLTQHERALQYFQQQEMQRQQQADIQSREQAFANLCAQSVNEFIPKAPDYLQAYAFLRDTYNQEFKMAGFDAPTVARLIEENELAIASIAFKAGANPAERIYNLAKHRGYQRQTAEPKINQIQKSVAASRSLGNSSGRSQKEFSLEAISQLNPEEFREFIQSDKNWEKIGKMLS